MCHILTSLGKSHVSDVNPFLSIVISSVLCLAVTHGLGETFKLVLIGFA